MILGVNVDAVKRLVGRRGGGPWLVPAPKSATRSFHGRAYVSEKELEKFQAKYLTLALIAGRIGLHFRAVQKLLEEGGIQPAFDPSSLGARVYMREDVSAFVLEYERRSTKEPGQTSRPENTVHSASDTCLISENACSGESDDVLL